MSETNQERNPNVSREVIQEMISAFGHYDDREPGTQALSIHRLATYYGLTDRMVRRSLITAGVYSTHLSRTIAKLKEDGNTISEIAAVVDKSTATVHSYLPYQGTERNPASLPRSEEETAVLERLKQVEGKTLYTIRGLPFSFTIRGREVHISRKQKPLTGASVLRAYQEAERMEGKVKGPKELKTFGASYLYSIFQVIGVIRKEN